MFGTTVSLGHGFTGGNNKPLRVVTEKAKKKKWMQDVEVKRPGICTGKKLGGPTCPPGSRQYALAKTFKKTAKKGGKSKKG